MPSLKGDLKEPTRKVKKVDQNKIRIGQEYLQDGILFDRTKKYFDSVGDGLRFIHTGSGGSEDVAEFYDFVSDVISSGKSKDQILLEIETKRGFLYGRLIERSAMPWVFFTPEERGDNDARDPSKLRPSSLNPDGSPNQIFLDFWSNYKQKWDAKYQEILRNLINPRVDSIILSGKSAAAKNRKPITDETRAKIGAASRGRKHSPETKARCLQQGKERVQVLARRNQKLRCLQPRKTVICPICNLQKLS